MNDLVRIADRVLNTPLLITPEKAGLILSVLSGRIGLSSVGASQFEGDDVVRDGQGNNTFVRKPYKVSGGVAIIPVIGTLVTRGAWIGANSGLTSYEGIQHQLRTALGDPDVRCVIIDLHTPGGEALGAFETAAMVRELAGKKSVTALVNGMAASAGYAIASGASKIVTTETGVSGSIGVVVLHADYSRKLDAEGITATLIFAGAHKVDGNPFEPIPEGVRADMQARVDAFYTLFVRTVAMRGTGRLDEVAIRATEARTYIGEAAVAAGLADSVGTFETVLAELQRATVRSPGRGKLMDNQNIAPAADAGISHAAHETALTAARNEGFQAGCVAENARLAAIDAHTLPGHEALAAEHKLDLSVTSEQSAIQMLMAEKKKKKPTASNIAATLAAMDQAAAGVTSSVSSDSSVPVSDNSDEGFAAQWSASPNLQSEFASANAYSAYKRAEADGRVRLNKSKQ